MNQMFSTYCFLLSLNRALFTFCTVSES